MSTFSLAKHVKYATKKQIKHQFFQTVTLTLKDDGGRIWAMKLQSFQNQRRKFPEYWPCVVEPTLEAPAELGERAELALTLSGLYPVTLMTRICPEQAGSFHSLWLTPVSGLVTGYSEIHAQHIGKSNPNASQTCRGQRYNDPRNDIADGPTSFSATDRLWEMLTVDGQTDSPSPSPSAAVS